MYLDVEKDDILTRQKKMKVSRIVDHTSADTNLTNGLEKKELADILQKRLVYYEKYFDVRVWPERGVSLEALQKQALDEILKMVDQAREKQYTSTRCIDDIMNENSFWNLKEVILSGMVPNEYGGGFSILIYSKSKVTSFQCWYDKTTRVIT